VLGLVVKITQVVYYPGTHGSPSHCEQKTYSLFGALSWQV